MVEKEKIKELQYGEGTRLRCLDGAENRSVDAVCAGRNGAEVLFFSRREDGAIRMSSINAESLASRQGVSCDASGRYFECYLFKRDKGYAAAERQLKTAGIN